MLLILSRGDRLVRPSIVRRFDKAPRARGVEVTMVEVTGGHARGIAQPTMRNAIRAFVARHGASG